MIQLAGLAAAVWVYRPDGSMFSRFVGQVGLVPCLLVGQITYLRWSGRIAGWTAVALTATALWLFTYTLTGVYPYLNEPANSFGVSFLYAYLMFIIAVLVNDRCRLPRFLEFFSDTSYSLYLNHAAVGFFMLDWLRHWRFELALVPTLAAVTATAWLSWLLVERPSQDLGRWLVHGLRKAWRNPDPVVASKVERPPLRRAA